ncbi:MAG: hypothetical protein HY000_41935 [Planctomycetes bacterium]|nr:hypothetical protein [Planctomycetota bacterium]
MPDLSPALIDVLEAERDALNARYLLRVRSGAKIDAEAFLTHLRQSVAPLVAKVHETLPERTRSAVIALYDASLDLFAGSLLGPQARLPAVQRAWTDVLPLAARLLARAPQQVAGSLCNAVFQVTSQPGTRPEAWLTRMVDVAPHCESVSQLLEAGKVAAWQAGMAQFRRQALEAATKLPAAPAAQALGLPRSTPPERLRDVLERLQADPWLTADAAMESNSQGRSLACVATVGAFCGFAGAFRRPPVVSCQGERFLASDGSGEWQLFADAYGAWFRRVGAASAKTTAATRHPGINIEAGGTIHWGSVSLAQPHLARASSLACDGATLAVTIPTSHHVFLYSRRGGTA